MSQIKTLQTIIHAWAVRKEWRGPKSSKRPLVADLCLFTSEISEALEELRKNDDPKHYYETRTAMIDGVKFANLTDEQVDILQEHIPFETGCLVLGADLKPEGVGPEFADLAIRLLETCEEYGLDLEFEIERKMAYNEKREQRHGGLLM